MDFSPQPQMSDHSAPQRCTDASTDAPTRQSFFSALHLQFRSFSLFPTLIFIPEYSLILSINLYYVRVLYVSKMLLSRNFYIISTLQNNVGYWM